MFTLHPRLEADSTLVGTLPLSQVRLVNDRRFPWLLLVPQRRDIRDIHQLSAEDRAQLMVESCALSEAMMRLFEGEKMNVAALGNMVPQLHVHHIVRYAGDLAWPGPIWGVGEAEPYPQHERVERARMVREAAELSFV